MVDVATHAWGKGRRTTGIPFQDFRLKRVTIPKWDDVSANRCCNEEEEEEEEAEDQEWGRRDLDQLSWLPLNLFTPFHLFPTCQNLKKNRNCNNKIITKKNANCLQMTDNSAQIRQGKGLSKGNEGVPDEGEAW